MEAKAKEEEAVDVERGAGTGEERVARLDSGAAEKVAKRSRHSCAIRNRSQSARRDSYP